MAKTRGQYRAHMIVNNAIRSGYIHRPSQCSCCGVTPPRGRDGRSLIVAHHPTYRKPKVIVWMCVKCHKKEHTA